MAVIAITKGSDVAFFLSLLYLVTHLLSHMFFFSGYSCPCLVFFCFVALIMPLFLRVDRIRQSVGTEARVLSDPQAGTTQTFL